ncbi:MAG: tetratricopeptide repeat protein [Flavobacteriales bacterium]
MLDLFSQIYDVLFEQERKQFHKWYDANCKGELEKKLYDLVRKRKPLSTEELAIKLYGDKTRTTAIRQLRQSLTERLVEFSSQTIWPQSRPTKTKSSRSSIRRIVDMADLLIERRATPVARHYLEYAYTNAKQARAWDFLETIGKFKLEHAQALGISAHEAYDTWQKDNEQYRSYMHVLHARNVLAEQLTEYRRQGVVPDQEQLILEFYGQFEPNEAERANPEFMLRICQMFRAVMLSSKDYWRLESFVREVWIDLLSRNAFTVHDDGVRREFLFMLAQAAFRNRSFEDAEDFLRQMQVLMVIPVQRNDPEYARMVSLRATLYMYTDRRDEAVEQLRKALYGPEPVEYETERWNMQLNLAVAYFCMKEFERALDQLARLSQPEDEYRETFGVEWIYKRRMIHVVILWESGARADAEDLLEKLLTDFAPFLQQEMYQRARVFMEFVLRGFRDPEIVRQHAFHLEVRDAHLGWGDREDIQAMFFFCWFRAWMLGQPFYDTFLDRLNEQGPNWDFPFSLK